MIHNAYKNAGDSKPSFFNFRMKSFRLHGVHLPMDDRLFQNGDLIV